MRTIGIDDLRISISEIKDIPTVPVVLTKILDLVEDQNSTIKDLEQAILSDQSITAKVLRLANSAFYGFPRKITTISKAVILIGFNSVKNIAIGVSVFEAFNRGRGQAAKEIEACWAHAVEVAYGAKMLAARDGYGMAEEAFVGGLLHDIGKVVLIYCDYEKYRPILEKGAEEPGPDSYLAAERLLLGTTHAAIGNILATHWQLPEALISCIRSHHRPETEIHHRKLVRVVALSNQLSHDETPTSSWLISQDSPTNPALPAQDVERFRDNMKRYAQEMQDFFSNG